MDNEIMAVLTLDQVWEMGPGLVLRLRELSDHFRNAYLI
jgi:hypothetical protein